MPKIVDHEDRRSLYVDALWRVVSREGAGAISVRSVAAEVGVSPATVLHYLPSRADLLGAAVQQFTDQGWERLQQLCGQSLDLDGAVDAVMIGIPDSPVRRRQSEVWLQLVAEQQSSPAARRILGDLLAEVRKGSAALITLFGENGLVHPDRDLAFEAERLHMLVDGVSLQTLINHRRMPPARIRTIVAGHVRELGSPPSTD
jgi:AcrR family transcriptional regulator